MELPQYPLGRWLFFPGNIIVLVPFAISSHKLIIEMMQILEDAILITSNDLAFPKGLKVYNPEGFKPHYAKSKFLIVDLMEPDYIQLSGLDTIKVIWILNYGFTSSTYNGIVNYSHPKLTALYKKDLSYNLKFDKIMTQGNVQSLKLGNMTYPKGLQFFLDLNPTERTQLLELDIKSLTNISEAPDLNKYIRDHKLLPDLIQPQGWIPENILSQLRNLSPKINQLLFTINYQERTVIYTEFTKRYGVQLLQSLIKIYGYDSIIIDPQLSDAEINSRVKAFNKLQSGILIMSTFPDLVLKRIDKIFILEGTNLSELDELLTLVNNKYSFNTFRIIEIFFMISAQGDQSLDFGYYKDFMISQDEKKEIWNKAITRSEILTYDGEIEQFIITPKI